MYHMPLPERQRILTERYLQIFESEYLTDYIGNPIAASGNMGQVLDEILPAFFPHKPHREDMMEDLFDQFIDAHFPGLERDIVEKINSNSNIYNMFNAVKLSGANSICRTLSTKLGNFWEVIANLSANVISPEVEFNIRLKGIDAILHKNGEFTYVQMKTQKNTLTGSQQARSESELAVYRNALFVACIDNNASWTYNGSTRRVVGRPFWDDCNISYDRLLSNIGRLIAVAEELLD